MDEIEKEVLAEDAPAIVHSWSVEEMAAVDGLTKGVERELPSAEKTTAADFVGRLATVSA